MACWKRKLPGISMVVILLLFVILGEYSYTVYGKSVRKSKHTKDNSQDGEQLLTMFNDTQLSDDDIYNDFLKTTLENGQNTTIGLTNSSLQNDLLGSNITNSTMDQFNSSSSLNGILVNSMNVTGDNVTVIPQNFTSENFTFSNSSNNIYNESLNTGSNVTLNNPLNDNMTSVFGLNNTVSFLNTTIKNNNTILSSENVTYSNFSNSNISINGNDTIMENGTLYHGGNFSTIINVTGTTSTETITDKLTTPIILSTPTTILTETTTAAMTTTMMTTISETTTVPVYETSTMSSTQNPSTAAATQYTTAVPTTQYTTTAASTQNPTTVVSTQMTSTDMGSTTVPYIEPINDDFLSSTPATPNYNQPTSTSTGSTTTQYPQSTTTIEYINGLQNYWNQRDKHYVTTVLIPVAAGVLGALFIVLVAYSIKNCGKKRQYTQMHSLLPETDVPRERRNSRSRSRTPQNSQRATTDRVMLLADSSDDDF